MAVETYYCGYCGAHNIVGPDADPPEKRLARIAELVDDMQRFVLSPRSVESTLAKIKRLAEGAEAARDRETIYDTGEERRR